VKVKKSNRKILRKIQKIWKENKFSLMHPTDREKVVFMWKSSFYAKNSVADPDPGSVAFLPLDPGWEQKFRTRIRDEHPGPYFRELSISF
jgi:hypothetical protein